MTGTGSLTIQPYTAGTNLHINDGTSSGLFLNSTEIGYVNNATGAASPSVMHSDTGLMTVGATTWTAPLTLLNGSGKITLAGAQTMGGNTFYANTTSGNLTRTAAPGNQHRRGQRHRRGDGQRFHQQLGFQYAVCGYRWRPVHRLFRREAK